MNHSDRVWPVFALSLSLGLAAAGAWAETATATKSKTTNKAPVAATSPTKIPTAAPAITPKTAPARIPGAKAPARSVGTLRGPALSRTPAEVNAARGLREVKEIGAGLLDTTGQQGHGLLTPGGTDLTKSRGTDRFGGVPADGRQKNAGSAPMPAGMPPMPALPSNRDKRPGSAVGSPSLNLRDHMRGATGQDNHGRVVAHESDGGVVPETGTVYSRETRVHEDGYTVTEVSSQHADGGSTVQTIRTDLENNTMTMDVVHRDREGNVTDKDRIVTEADTGGGDIAGTQDPNADSNSGGCNPVTGRCSGQGAKDPNRVNPGREGAATVPTATRLKIDQKGLVTNPANARQIGSGGTPRPLENTVNQVDPPKPGHEPR